MLKHLITIFLLLLLPLTGKTQTYYQVTSVSGTQTIGGVDVTVTPSGGATSQGALCGSDGPYWIGYTTSGSYKYAFSSHVSFIKLHIGAINITDTIAIKINGVPYSITSANISAISTSCNNTGSVVINNGMIEGTTITDPLAVQFYEHQSSIDSIEIMQINGSSGVVYDLYFATSACPGVLNLSHDSACIGLPLHLYTNNTGISNNAIYSWTGANSFTSSQENPVISNTTATVAGTYVLTVNDTGCIYKDSMVITPHNAATTLMSNSPVCSGSPLNLSAVINDNASFQWSGPNNFNSTQQNPVINNTTTSASGKYFVIVSVSGCTAHDSTDIVVKNTPATPTATNNGPLCAGSNLILSATDATTGVSYSWKGPGNYTSIQQNPQIATAQTSDAGMYTVYATLNGCYDSAITTAVINPTLGAPVATISSDKGSSICTDSTATFSVTTTNTDNPTYQWRKNGVDINGATAVTYTPPTISDGDIFSCYVTSNAPCQSTTTGLSNFFVMHTITNAMPQVSISVYPPVFVQGDTTTFTAHAVNTTGLSYQWRINGVNIPGATTSTFSTDTLNTGDIISVFVTSNVPCTFPDTVTSNQITLSVQRLPVNVVNLSLFPNPNKGTFTITGTAEEKITIEIYNPIGQLIQKQNLQPQNNMLNKNIILDDAADGLYLLHVSADGYNKTIPFIVNN